MPTLQEIKKQLNLDFATRMSRWADIRQLPSVMWNDEIAHKLCACFRDNSPATLVATNKRLIVLDKKLMGVSVESFSYAKITAVRYGNDVWFGEITIATPAGDTTFKHLPRNEATELARYIQEQTDRAT